jgi:PLP dependent protein
MQTTMAENLSELRHDLAEICRKCGRDPREITILAVTKTFPAAVIRDAVSVGLTDIGESRVQEAEAKFAELGHVGRYHLIGHLQSNKVKKAVQLFDVIQTVDSLDLAQEISRRAGEIQKRIECLVEINSSGEDQKFGVAPDRALELITQMRSLPEIKLGGLMTVGPLTEDEDLVRAAFHMCRTILVDGKRIAGDQFATLSMGMSSDFEIAIEEGSTMIRIGTRLFGGRPARP